MTLKAFLQQCRCNTVDLLLALTNGSNMSCRVRAAGCSAWSAVLEFPSASGSQDLHMGTITEPQNHQVGGDLQD